MATTKPYRYIFFPCPNGNCVLAGCAARFNPYRIRILFPVPTIEWTPSDNIAELPVILTAINFIMEISVLPISAAIIIFFDSEAIEKLKNILELLKTSDHVYDSLRVLKIVIITV